MKKIIAILLTLIMVFALSSCSLYDYVGEAFAEEMRAEFGDEVGDMLDEAVEQNKQELENLENEWDGMKDQLQEEANAAIEEEFGEKAGIVQTLFGGLIDWFDSLFGAKWDYPVADATCSWRGFEEETLSWSEWEFATDDGRSYHIGLDLKSKSGSLDILAASDGTVVYSSGSGDVNGANGYRVVIEHEIDGKTVYSFYGHLADYKDLPAKDTEVKCGDRIGTMGTTGYSGGVHLHFAVYDTYTADPLGRSYKFTGNTRVHNGITYYNPKYIIENGELPE